MYSDGSENNLRRNLLRIRRSRLGVCVWCCGPSLLLDGGSNPVCLPGSHTCWSSSITGLFKDVCWQPPGWIFGFTWWIICGLWLCFWASLWGLRLVSRSFWFSPSQPQRSPVWTHFIFCWLECFSVYLIILCVRALSCILFIRLSLCSLWSSSGLAYWTHWTALKKSAPIVLSIN